jgi:mono/diheme cytochrome c family protein
MLFTRTNATALASATLALIFLPACGPKAESAVAAPASAATPTAAASTAPAETSAPPPSTVAAASSPAAAPAAGGAVAYKVVDGYKVDPVTLTGFRTWRAAACDRCHGANQEGMVGPSLVNSLKTLTQQEFVTTVTKGRLEKGMPSFATSTQVTENIGALYQYLKGRSDGAITRAKVEPMS